MEMEPGYSQSFEDADEGTIAEATIAVEGIGGSVLLVSGGADGMWDSVRLHEVAATRLDQHDCEFVMGGSATGYTEADSDHWQHVVETLRTCGIRCAPVGRGPIYDEYPRGTRFTPMHGLVSSISLGTNSQRVTASTEPADRPSADAQALVGDGDDRALVR
ncbi:alpha/beta hydrolase family protein [Natrinema altunense]|uniref:Uncharacterized protein n=1 Tax=Natrinema altunense TaxID=222984 RepID=A0A482XTX6_9EURY|nr:acyl-CoA thioester hydrolase/BAAT C-terminal domain-containing protein [Natrinema altunense]RZH66489.1 hypothetical protein ELS17_17625 [Natrinema altunense]